MFTLSDDYGPIASLYYGMPDGNTILEMMAYDFIDRHGMNGIRTTLPADYLD